MTITRSPESDAAEALLFKKVDDLLEGQAPGLKVNIAVNMLAKSIIDKVYADNNQATTEDALKFAMEMSEFLIEQVFQNWIRAGIKPGDVEVKEN